MAELRCIYCARPQGEPHTQRCGVLRQHFAEDYVEFPGEVVGERNRFRAALETLRDRMSIDPDDGWSLTDVQEFHEIVREALEGPFASGPQTGANAANKGPADA